MASQLATEMEQPSLTKGGKAECSPSDQPRTGWLLVGVEELRHFEVWNSGRPILLLPI